MNVWIGVALFIIGITVAIWTLSSPPEDPYV